MSSDEQKPARGFPLLLVIIAVVLGLTIPGLIVGALGYYSVKKAHADARRGWNLVPVVVAAQDIPENTTLTNDMIAQRSIPEQFVTSSVVKPDSAHYILNQVVRAPLQAGDPLLWTQFASGDKVLVATQDLPVGTVLKEEDVIELSEPKDLITPSFVKPEARPQLMGRKVIAPFRRRDPILWTHFQGEPPPVAAGSHP